LSTSDASDWLPLWSRLFQTHYAVCSGAREYGEFYLNLRGGLAASLANCADEPDAERRLLQRGARRMLALGWFAVESVRGAEHHPHRVRERVCAACNSLPKPSCEHDHSDKVSEPKPGQSLPPDLANRLLREILTTHKSITEEAALAEWVSDCVLALTAHIRPDAVIVNRAAAFAEWQNSVGDSGTHMSDQARRILFAMCGDGFASLTLPEEDAVKQDDEQADADSPGADDVEGEDIAKSKGEADDVEPSKASRGVFGDLFGGDPVEKISRAQGKEDFAICVRKMLTEAGNVPPTQNAVIAFRAERGLPDLDTSHPDKYPQEVSSSGRPNDIAKRYRKLLVGLNLWPKSNEESGLPRVQAISSFGKRVTAQDEQSRNAHINALDLINACPEPTASCDGEPDAPSLKRVFTPPWASALAERVAAATNMPVNAKPLNEFKRLMFALAARRISQTQTWTKRNEVERHKAAVKEDAAKKRLEELDPAGSARAWFSEYEKERGEDSQASSDFRITRRMISECDPVFNAWQGTESADEREKETASVQAKTEKFGDARLYADLSEDPAAVAVWQHAEGAEILAQWVKLRQAQYDQQRLKIPRFCHPDPFHHPTWCEFGGSSKPKVWYAWKAGSNPSSAEPGGNADGSRRLWMLLPDFGAGQARAVPMRWRNKRLSQDLGGVRGHTDVQVPRADRLSLAAAKLPLLDANDKSIRYRPEYPFTKDATGWNARLQLDRDTLKRLERHWDDGCREWRDGGKALRNGRWFVTFAPTLAVSDGPGRSIHPKLGWKSSPHFELNKKQKRVGHAELILSRLPGLRILSVDLGHRFAAACAVWETPDAATFDIRKVITDAQAQNWAVDGSADGLFVHIHEPTEKIAKKGRHKGKPVFKTTIFRRVGEDFLRNSKTGVPTTTPHPAPWARLDRQFLIKLPGEDKPARAASQKGQVNEVAMVAKLAADLGLMADEDRDKGREVNELMGRAVRIAALGLKRHARRAKIAYAFDLETQIIPGIGGSEKPFTPGDAAHIKLITDALFDWHALASESKWDDKPARDLWNRHIATTTNGWWLEEPKPPDENSEGPNRQQRRKEDEVLLEKLKPVAEQLAAADRSVVHAAWLDRWQADDRNPANPDMKEKAIGLFAQLRWLTDWIMGGRLPGVDKEDVGWKQNVGGLSLTRIATMKSLYQLHKAFAMRAKPDKPRGAPEKGETNAGVAQSILDAMEQMREQRVKQLASRIAGSALGLGGHWKQAKTRRKNADGLTLMKWVWVEEPTAKYAPCHAIVIENLTNYRPDEIQTRRENRQLMAWSSSKVKKYLSEACQLHGLHLREVQAGYTSRQDSRTGAPGIRCADVPVVDFMTKPWWRRQAKVAQEKADRGDARDRFLVMIEKQWSSKSDSERKFAPAIRIPMNGGELFVSADPCSPAAKGLQADLNAAANIGLKALLDPDFSGKWWFIPCEAATHKPHPEKTKGSFVIPSDLSLISIKSRNLETLDPKIGKNHGRLRAGKKEREIANLWRDISVFPIDANSPWRGTAEYWNDVRFRVISLLHKSRPA